MINEDLCLARVRNLGKGGQCRRRRLPAREFCYEHSCKTTLKYGRVTEPIPEKELRWLLRGAELAKDAELSRELRQRAREQEQAAAPGSSEAVPVRVCRRGRKWYTRSYMWHFAKELFDAAHGGNLGSIRELAPEEYRECLDKVNKYLKDHRALREEVGRGHDARSLVDAEKGPVSAADQGLGVYSVSGAGSLALEDYNGVGGGYVHKWYQREEFDRQLSVRGVDRVTCNERVCVEALSCLLYTSDAADE